MARKKKDNSKEDLEYKKAIEKGLKEFNAKMKKLSKCDFEDFKKGIIKQLRETEESLYGIQDAILLVAKNDGDQREMMANELAKAYKKQLKDFDKGIEILDGRLQTVEHLLLFLTTKSMEHFKNRTMDYEWIKDMASILSIDWDQIFAEWIASIKKTDELDIKVIKNVMKMDNGSKAKLSRAIMLVKNAGMSMERALYKTGFAPEIE